MPKLVNKIYPTVIILLLGCQCFGAIFGIDNRIKMRSSQYPWSSIGRLTVPGGHSTAVLVDKDIILTNLHCIINPKTGSLYNPSELKFYPNYHRDNKKNHFSSAVKFHLSDLFLQEHTNAYNYQSLSKWHKVKNSNPYLLSLDWVLIRLKDPIGKRESYNFLQIDPQGMNSPHKGRFNLYSYSTDVDKGQIPTLHEGFSLKTFNEKNTSADQSFLSKELLIHDGDMSTGGSGAPIIHQYAGQWYICGLNTAEVVDKKNRKPGSSIDFNDKFHHLSKAFNLAIGTQSIAEKIQKLTDTYPRFTPFNPDKTKELQLQRQYLNTLLKSGS